MFLPLRAIHQWCHRMISSFISIISVFILVYFLVEIEGDRQARKEEHTSPYFFNLGFSPYAIQLEIHVWEVSDIK
jgi:hypothetical protein